MMHFRPTCTNTIQARVVAYYDGNNADYVAAVIGHDRALAAKTLLQVVFGGDTLLVKRYHNGRFEKVPPRSWLVRTNGKPDAVLVFRHNEIVIRDDDPV